MVSIDELKDLLNKTDVESCKNQCPMVNIADYLVTILQNPMNGLSSEAHSDHHDWIQLQINRERKKQERRQKIIDGVKQQVIGWTIISFIGSILSGIGYWAYKFYSHLK